MPVTEFYFFRHAESFMNINPQLIGGRSNETPLTENGINQAQLLGLSLARHNIIPDKIYSSPAKRTLQTAGYTLGQLGMGLDVVTIDDQLQEMSQGQQEGRERSLYQSTDVQRAIELQQKDYKAPGGESMNEVGSRMHNWVMRVALGETKDQIVFVFSHGLAIRCLAAANDRWPHGKVLNEKTDNTSANLFVMENGNLKIGFLNRILAVS